MTEEPKLIDIKRHCDDRGILDAVLDIQKTKRVYCTQNYKGVIRAWHGHRTESKIFYVPRGMVKVLAFNMDDENNEPAKIKEFVLSEHKPQILTVPNNFYHGYSTLSEDSIVFIFSDKELEESQKDDYRLDALIFGHDIWGVKNR